MSLEAVIEKNTAALEKHAALLEQLLAKTGATAATAPAAQSEAAAPAAEDKPKATGKKTAAAKTEEKSEAAEVTVETLDAKFRPWLGEFAKDHPETAARRAKFKELLTKLGAGKMSEITDATKLGKLDNWFETKAKTEDIGFGPGRFAADPDEGGEDASDEDEL